LKFRMWLPLVTVAVLVSAFVLWLSGAAHRAYDFSTAALVIVAAPLLLQTVRKALQGDFATDAAAALAIITALMLGQPIPGLIVVLMQSGGEALEQYAQRRASNALHELEASAPRIAHRLQGDIYQDVEVGALQVEDIILIRPGEAMAR
jgi:cation transport ATPase